MDETLHAAATAPRVQSLALGGFTVLAALLADRFWAAPQAERQRAANAFFEHRGLVGGMLLVVWHDLGGFHAG